MKNLITDILQYLKDNEEAREMLEEVFRDDSMGYHDIETYYTLFLIYTLSSPNGKPICKFLEEEVFSNDECIDSIATINHAKNLRTIYLDALDEGESHDEAYKLINKEYNKL